MTTQYYCDECRNPMHSTRSEYQGKEYHPDCLELFKQKKADSKLNKDIDIRTGFYHKKVVRV